MIKPGRGTQILYARMAVETCSQYCSLNYRKYFAYDSKVAIEATSPHKYIAVTPLFAML